MKSRGHYKIAVLILQVVFASYLQGFEQGNYFIFDITDSTESKPILGRLAVPAEALAKVEAEPAVLAAQTEERGEFEIDFNQAIRSGIGGASFELDTKIEVEPEPETTSFSTEPFDFGSSNSVFGQ